MKTLLKNGRILDGLGNVIERGWILIEGRLIVSLGQDEPKLQDRGSGSHPPAVVDLEGDTVLPGLIDTHVHLSLDGSPDPLGKITNAPDPTVTLQTAHHARLTLEAGITTVRDVGSKNFIDIHVRDAVKTGLFPGPGIFCAGQMICITGGQGWQVGCQADGPDDVRRAARLQIRAGVDLIKFMATGGVLTRGGRPGMPQLTLEELRAGIEEAHKASLKTAAHAQGIEGTRNAVLAGIDSIEHGVSLDREIIEEMIRKDVFLVPTLSAPVNILRKGKALGIPEEFIDKTERLADIHIQSLCRAREAGVKIAMGTDAGTPFNHHGENASELTHMVKTGFSAHEAIICATSRAAELMGIQDTLGSIRPDRQADLLIVKGNPVEDISILSRTEKIVSVYKEGKIVINRMPPGRKKH